MKMKTKSITIILISIGSLFLGTFSLANNELAIIGRIEGIGTFFEIKDSQYLNISLKSTEEIKVVLESIPRMISINLESSSTSSSTIFTLEGLKPNKTYYRYQDSYKNGAVFVLDEIGSYSWTQDLSQAHHIWFQEAPNVISRDFVSFLSLTQQAIFLPEQCSAYGTWDSKTSTCTLNQDLTQSVEMTDNNISLDCNDHSITGSGFSGYGIYLNSKTGIAIQKCFIKSFSSNIYLWNSDNNYFSDNSIEGQWKGISLSSSFNNIITNNNISDHLSFGIDISSVDSNKVYHNNFINNGTLNAPPCSNCGTQAYIRAGNIDNGYPSGGNYWSDYVSRVQGEDLYSGPNQDQPGSDGIGDIPYKSFGSGQDRYPFVEESGWVVSPIPAYNVAVILAEPVNVSHDSSLMTAKPCKLLTEKTYSNGHSKEYYQDLAYCVADYHRENSFGKVNLNFTIYDNDSEWFRTDKNESDYLGKEDEFVKDAINLVLDSGIDLSNQDMVVTVHSGTSGQRKKNKLFTQTWTLDGHPLGYPPYKIIVAEDDLVGAWAHEIGHLIGALITPESTIIPDLYKMGNVEEWDLMARGSWNDRENNPPQMSSYVKEFLQWLNYEIYPKSAYGEYWINSLTTSSFGDDVFRYNLCDNTNDDCPEYYILEVRNRTLKTWDSSLPGLPIVGDKNLVLYYVDTKGLPEYGYVPENVEGYQKGMMWNQYRNINIPNKGDPLNDGILNPLINETYRDLDNLVKFSAMTDRTINDRYEMQARIEEITYDSFNDKFWGVILRPKSTFREWIKRIFNPDSPAENSIQLATALFSSQERKVGIELPPKPTIIEQIKGVMGAYDITEFTFITIIFIVLLNLLLILLNKIFSRLKLERIQKLTKIAIKILWIIAIIIISIYIFLVILVYTLPEPPKPPITPPVILKISPNNLGQLTTPPLEPTTLPDLDLHLYCDDGRHIGINYETGKYEVQISEAIVSGNNQNAPEWIFIPENVTNCHYVVSSYNNQKFLEENPEIAQEIEDTTDSYEVYARYIDPATDIYTSTIISEDIEPGAELKHLIGGTDDIAIEQGILIARVDFDPDTLNLKSKGKYVTVYIELPVSYDVNDINVASIKLNNQIQAETKPTQIGDYDNNGAPDLMVKLDRAAVQTILKTGDKIKITISGRLNDGRPFEGTDTIKVIDSKFSFLNIFKNILNLFRNLFASLIEVI